MRRVLASTLIVGVVMALGSRLLATGGGNAVDPFDAWITVDTTTTLKTGGATVDWHARASIKRRSDAVLVLVFYSAEAHQTNQGALHIRFSDDNGATWTADDTTLSGNAVSGFPMNPPDATSSEDAGEGWLYVAPNGDLLLHMWEVDYGVSLGGTWQSRSTDGGETWTTPAQVSFGISGVSDDIVFATDDHFVYDRTIYAGARVYTGGADGVPSQSILIKSDDDAATWSKVSTIMDDTEGDATEKGGQEVGLEYVGNDTIVAMIRDNAHEDSYKRVSTDIGQTWGTLENVTADVGIAARQRLYTRMHLQGEAGWWKDPVLIMTGFVHQSSGNSHPRRNAIWISPDRTETWDGPHYIDAQTEDAGYGDIFWNGSGYSVVSYQGTLDAADLKQYDLTISFS